VTKLRAKSIFCEIGRLGNNAAQVCVRIGSAGVYVWSVASEGHSFMSVVAGFSVFVANSIQLSLDVWFLTRGPWWSGDLVHKLLRVPFPGCYLGSLLKFLQHRHEPPWCLHCCHLQVALAW
jgi:hypothetical protein